VGAAGGVDMTTQLVDLDNSYFTFTVPDGHNSARIQLDAACRTFEANGKSSEVFLFSSCKSEFMYRESGLFQDPNFDFCGVVSNDSYVLNRTWVSHDPSRAIEMQAGPVSSNFSETRIDLRRVNVRPLTTDKAIYDATWAMEKILARLHLEDRHTGRRAEIDYVVKTMNVAKPTGRFQTDTGPIIVPRWVAPDLERVFGNGPLPVQQVLMAFVSCNRFTGGDLVVRVPTPVSGEANPPKTWHYSKLVPIPTARHEFFAVTG
jgi:hypothetical protein